MRQVSRLNRVSIWFIFITGLSIFSDFLANLEGTYTCTDRLFPDSVKWLNPIWWFLTRFLQADGAIIPCILLFYKSPKEKRASFVDKNATRFGSSIDEILDNDSDYDTKSQIYETYNLSARGSVPSMYIGDKFTTPSGEKSKYKHINHQSINSNEMNDALFELNQKNNA